MEFYDIIVDLITKFRIIGYEILGIKLSPIVTAILELELSEFVPVSHTTIVEIVGIPVTVDMECKGIEIELEKK